MYLTGNGPEITANYIVLNNLWINGTGNPLELLNTTGCIVRNCNLTSGNYAPQGLWLSGSTNCEIDHNYISMNGTSGSSVSWGITDNGAGSGGNIVVNNTIYSGTGGGYYSPDDLTGRVFENNIVYECGYGVCAGNTGITHGYNMFFGTTGNVVTPGTDSTYVLAASETTNVDPQLNSDNSLQSTSPAIDAGVYVGLPFQGSWPDIGAYEYPSTVPAGFATVTGSVLNGSAPVSGALVTAGPNSQAATTTDVSGNYTLLQIPAASQPMTASQGANSNSKTVVLSVGADTVNFNFLPSCTATGRITDAYTGAGISGVTVSYDTATATTNSSGYYTVTAFTGSHVFSLSETGYTNPVGGGTFTLVAGSNIHNGTLQQICVATGQITDANGGAGISGVTVSYDAATATTDSNGNYSVTTVTGSHLFSFSETGYTSPVGGGTVVLTGVSSPGHNGTLRQVCVATGQITDANGGAGISGVTVSYDAATGRQTATVTAWSPL